MKSHHFIIVVKYGIHTHKWYSNGGKDKSGIIKRYNGGIMVVKWWYYAV